MKIALGSDHRGDTAVQALVTTLQKMGHETVVLAECRGQTCDYPDNAYRVAKAVADGEFDRGILICGSGVGMSIAANKVPGVRAVLACDDLHARLGRSHNDANVLCMGADTTGAKDQGTIAQTFLTTEFEGGRHARRVAKMAVIERGEDPATASSMDAAVG